MAGPTPVAEAPVTVVAHRALPDGLAPEYVRTLATIDEAGRPQRWEGGPFHHCFRVSADEAASAEAAAQRMTAISGIPRTEAGPCNVEWVSDSARGHTYTEIHGSASSIVYAKVLLRSANSPTVMLHEAGHVLGLALQIDPRSGDYIHSPRSGDLMYASPRARDFSADELAVLSWMYDR
jgi:hypothetical protein